MYICSSPLHRCASEVVLIAGRDGHGRRDFQQVGCEVPGARDPGGDNNDNNKT